MDPSIIGNVDSLYALLGLGIVAITILILDQRRRQDRVSTVQAASETDTKPNSNGNSKYATKDYVEARVGQHEIHCSQAEDIKKTLIRLEAKIDGLIELKGGRV